MRAASAALKIIHSLKNIPNGGMPSRRQRKPPTKLRQGESPRNTANVFQALAPVLPVKVR